MNHKIVAASFFVSAPLMATNDYECYHFHQWSICENDTIICKVDRNIGMSSLVCEAKDEILKEVDLVDWINPS